MAELSDKQRVRDADRRRIAAANNSAAIAQRIGGVPNASSFSQVRIECLLDRVLGTVELNEDGSYLSGSIERLEFEAEAQEGMLAAMQRAEEMAAQMAGGQPGRTASGLVVPK